MNEKVILLYKEAAEFAYKVCKEEGRTGGPTDHIWNTLSTGKFAELIVQECLTVITPTEHDTGSYVDFSNGLKLARVRIKKHFGVEE